MGIDPRLLFAMASHIIPGLRAICFFYEFTVKITLYWIRDRLDIRSYCYKAARSLESIENKVQIGKIIVIKSRKVAPSAPTLSLLHGVKGRVARPIA